MSDHKNIMTEIKHLPHPHLHEGNKGRACHQFGPEDPQHPHHSHTIKHGGFVGRIMHHHKIVSTTVAVAGVTGKLGRLIAKHLLDHPDVQVHGIARNPDKLPDHLKSHPQMTLFKSSMTDVVELREAIKGCSILISTVLSDPSSELAMQKTMIDACVAEKVPRFMPNEFTFDWRTIDLDLLPHKKTLQELHGYIDHQKGKVKGVHVLIGAFMETMFSVGYLFDPSKSPADGLSTWGTGDDVIELTSYDNTAQWAVAVALDEDATGFFRFVGDRLTAKEIAQTLQEVYDTAPIKFTSKGTLAELKEEVKLGVARNPDPKINSLDDFWDWVGKAYTLFLTNGHAYLETPLQNQIYATSVQSVTFEEWLSDKKIEELSQTVSRL